MARITVGVPVYNEAELLAGSLEELRTQPFLDIEVLIFDNASTDASGDVARDFVARDARFRYFRQSENKGALRNFQDVLEAATAEYFMWKACDDRSDPNYITTLVRLLDQNPSVDLAVGRIVSRRMGRDRSRETPVPKISYPVRASDRIRLLFRSHASWIYGVFRREPLTARMREAVREFGEPWAFDHLVLFPYLFDGRVVGSNETVFRQILKSSGPKVNRQTRAADLGTMVELRRRFLKRTRADIALRVASPIARRAWDCVLWLVVGKRVYSLTKLTRSRIKLALGISGHK
jgi:glycosyltransferase involved in cell wall biosynthesis